MNAQGSGTSKNDVLVVTIFRSNGSKSRLGIGTVLKDLACPLKLLDHSFVKMHERAVGVVATARLRKLEAITGVLPTSGIRFGTSLRLGSWPSPSRRVGS